MKFKVGDIIKGIGKNRYSYTNTDMTKGRVIKVYEDVPAGERDIRIEVLEHTSKCVVGAKFDVKSKYFELVTRAAFGKADLKTGMRALMRDGGDYVVMKDTDCEDRLFSIYDEYGTEPLRNYNEDLTNKISSACDIDAIYKPKYTYVMFGIFNRLDFELVWKREEEPIEITIKEIAEMKGVSPERIRIRED